jgi:hypothetical protein
VTDKRKFPIAPPFCAMFEKNTKREKKKQRTQREQIATNGKNFYH